MDNVNTIRELTKYEKDILTLALQFYVIHGKSSELRHSTQSVLDQAMVDRMFWAAENK